MTTKINCVMIEDGCVPIPTNISNSIELLYIKGDANTDGSVRFGIDQDLGIAIVEERASGVWNPASLGAGADSVFVGLNLRISSAGHHLSTVDPDGHKHYFAHRRIINGVSDTATDCQILNAYGIDVRQVIQPDNSVTFAGVSLLSQYVAGGSTLSRIAYLQTGTTAATSGVRLRVFRGITYTVTSVTNNGGIAVFNHAGTAPSVGDKAYLYGFSNNTYNVSGTVTAAGATTFEIATIAYAVPDTGNFTSGYLTFDKEFPASSFPAISEIQLSTEGALEFIPAQTYSVLLESSSNFSLKTNAAGTLAWMALDVIFTREDDILNTLSWRDGDNFNLGQWLIANKKIYRCNITGIQTGTFASNSEKWNVIDDVINPVGYFSEAFLKTNFGYTTVAAVSGGLVVNYLPTSTVDTVDAEAFTAGVPSTSNPTIVTVGSGTFSQNDIIEIIDTSTDENKGIFEVEDHTGTLLTTRGVGTVPTVESFSKQQFVTIASDSATITKINVSVLRAGTDGNWEQGKGSVTPITYFVSGPDLWTRTGTTLSPATAGDSVQVGNLNINANTVTSTSGDTNVASIAGNTTISSSNITTISSVNDVNITPGSSGKITLTTDNNDIVLNPVGPPGGQGVKLSQLTANSGLYTDSVQRMTNTAPTSGDLGYWNKTATTLSPATAGDDITTTGKLNIGISQTPPELASVKGNTGGTFIQVRDERSLPGDVAGIKFSTMPSGQPPQSAKSMIVHQETSTFGIGTLKFCSNGTGDITEVSVADEIFSINSGGVTVKSTKTFSAGDIGGINATFTGTTKAFMTADSTVPYIADTSLSDTALVNTRFVNDVYKAGDAKNAVAAVATADHPRTGHPTLHGYTTVTNDRVLLTGQTNAAENGPYIAASGSWARADDWDETLNARAGGQFTVANPGTTKNGYQYVCTTQGTIVINVTETTWYELSPSVLKSDGGTNILSVTDTSATYNSNIISTVGAQVVEVWSLDDLPTAISGTITLEYKFYRFMQGVDFGTTQINLENDNYVLFEAADVFVTSNTYSGTAPWFIGKGSVRCVGNGLTWNLTADNATMFDLIGGWGMDYSTIQATGTGSSLGSIKAPVSSGVLLGTRFVATRSLISGFKYGINLYNVGAFWATLTVFDSPNDADGAIINLHENITSATIAGNEVTILSPNCDFMYISPTVTSPLNIENTILTDKQLFFKAGTTGTFTVVADASIGATAITSVTDSSGIARFNYTGSTVYPYQEVVLSALTNYTNGTYILTTVGAGYFEILRIDYNGADTGSFLSNSVTLTDTGTTLVNGDTILIKTTLSADYDGGSYVYNKQTNTVQVNIPESKLWTATATGTWNSGSLTQDSKYIEAHNNGSQENSMDALFAYVNTNATQTTFLAIDTWYSVELGTIVEGIATSRFKYIGDNTFKVTTLTPVKGVFEANLTGFKLVGNKDYNFRLMVTSGTGSFDNAVKAHSIGTDSSSFAVKASGSLVPGDEFVLEVSTPTTLTNSAMTITGYNGGF